MTLGRIPNLLNPGKHGRAGIMFAASGSNCRLSGSTDHGGLQRKKSSVFSPQFRFWCISRSHWCDSVGWASSCKLKGLQFDSGQGTGLGGRFGPQLGVCKKQPIHVSLSHRCFSPSLSPSLPLSLESIKEKRLTKLTPAAQTLWGTLLLLSSRSEAAEHPGSSASPRGYL